MTRFALIAALACAVHTAAAEQAPSALAPPGDAQILVLGEVHDNAAHHATQAQIVGLVRSRAVVWEMLTPEQLEAAAAVDRADAAAFGAALGWEAAGWPDFAMYHPIVLAAGDAVLIGAAVGRDRLRQAMDTGAAAAFGKDSIPLPPLDPADQAGREAEQAEAHCNALPAALLPGMVEAQRLRDAEMADAALRALERHGPPVVVITGSGHARNDRGVPAMIRAAAPGVRVWSLGQTEGKAGDAPPFDAVIVTAPTPRPDPCAAFATPEAATDGN